MPPENISTPPNQVPAQIPSVTNVQMSPEIPEQPKQKRVIYYLIGLFAVILIVFISWGGYQIYQYNISPSPSYLPGPTPPVSIILPSNTPPKETPRQGAMVCINGGCTVYAMSDAKKFCPKIYTTNNCDNECGDPKYDCSI